MHFCKELGAESLPPHLVKQWEDYAWPGNVRELRNAVARRAALGDLDDSSDVPPLSASVSGRRPAIARRDDPFARALTLDLPLAEARKRILDEFENRYIEHVLEVHGGNVTRAAAAAGIGRRHMQRLKLRLTDE
jgi:DNA-binding NtrC family response regulator